MIREFEFYHGAVLAKLLHEGKRGVSLRPYPTPSNASYILNDAVGVFIKHSKKRMSPWTFSFSMDHQDEILRMKNELGEVFLILVCGEDGIVALSFDELKKILNDAHSPVEWIRISRMKRGEYTVTGSDGALKNKIAQNEFPGKLFETKTDPDSKKGFVFTWFNSSQKEAK